MAEPLKNLLDEKVIRGMGLHFQRRWSRFDAKGFVKAAIKDLHTLELKQRTERITQTMLEHLPADFNKAGRIMLASLGPPLKDEPGVLRLDARGITGWAVMPLVHYVALHGQEHFALSMNLLKEMTKRASSEFGIRYFLLSSPEKTLAVLRTWTKDGNQHVRRLVSEGTRPRLPWAMNLPMFIKDPTPVIALLERLKDDDQEYVRRSVANNLNDIAKDHPQRVANIAARWLKGADPERQKLIRHACRTLIKQGHKTTLRVLGFKPCRIERASITLLASKVRFGEALQFSLSISSDARQDQAVVIDYIIHHRKANGSTSPKVFKWRTTTLPPNTTLALTRKHALRKITTRVYHPGLHTVEVMVNGVSVGQADFKLVMP